MDKDALAQNLVPLLGRPSSDTWDWFGEHHGLYSVKSGCPLLASDEAQHRSLIFTGKGGSFQESK